MTHVNFPDGLPEEDEGTFRIAAASNGLVPLFKNLSESKVKKMLEEAESKLSGAEFLTYKKKLADWMQECAMEDCAKDGKDFPNIRMQRSLIICLVNMSISHSAICMKKAAVSVLP